MLYLEMNERRHILPEDNSHAKGKAVTDFRIVLPQFGPSLGARPGRDPQRRMGLVYLTYFELVD